MNSRASIAMHFLAAALALAACGQNQDAAPRNAVADAGPNGTAAPRNKMPAPAPESAVQRTGPWSPSGYALNGTEPFWGGSISGTSIRYMTPEDQFGDVIETRAAYAADGETYSGTWRGRPFILTLTRASCSDGMSDRVYSFTAALQVAGGTRRGCADPQ